jgi:hypothetical protein
MNDDFSSGLKQPNKYCRILSASDAGRSGEGLKRRPWQSSFSFHPRDEDLRLEWKDKYSAIAVFLCSKRRTATAMPDSVIAKPARRAENLRG